MASALYACRRDITRKRHEGMFEAAVTEERADSHQKRKAHFYSHEYCCEGDADVIGGLSYAPERPARGARERGDEGSRRLFAPATAEADRTCIRSAAEL